MKAGNLYRPCAWLVLGLATACSQKGNQSSGLQEGQTCQAPGTQSSCSGGQVCTFYDAGAGIDICRTVCTSDSDCNQVFSENRCQKGVCSCSPAPFGQDPCTASNPGYLCHPIFDYCTPVADAGCPSGEIQETYDTYPICVPVPRGYDAGVDGGPSDGGCGSPDTQGHCSWPSYCATGEPATACAVGQNMSAGGQDAPSSLCNNGNNNLDQNRQSGNFPTGSSGPIVMDLVQDSNTVDCQNYNLTPDPSHSSLCLGDGNFCAATDSVVVFEGNVYDPLSAFAINQLDSQFYRLDPTGNGAAQLGQTSAESGKQIGHVVPGAGWSSSGGSFVLWRCFTQQSLDNYVNSSVPAHFAQTSAGAGNTFCSAWQE